MEWAEAAVRRFSPRVATMRRFGASWWTKAPAGLDSGVASRDWQEGDKPTCAQPIKQQMNRMKGGKRRGQIRLPRLGTDRTTFPWGSCDSVLDFY